MDGIELDWPSVKSENPPCPKCGGTDLHYGYGFAAGGLGSYTICLDCDETIERALDSEADEKIPERNISVANGGRGNDPEQA